MAVRDRLRQGGILIANYSWDRIGSKNQRAGQLRGWLYNFLHLGEKQETFVSTHAELEQHLKNLDFCLKISQNISY